MGISRTTIVLFSLFVIILANSTQIQPISDMLIARAPDSDTCGENEYLDSCGGCEGTCTNKNVMCTMICKSQGACKCSPGYLRHEGKCIAEDSCPKKDQDPWHPCTTHKCESGSICEEQNVTCIMAPCYPIAQCVPIDACATMRCGFNTTCQLVDGHASCVAAGNNTQESQCGTNQEFSECVRCEGLCGNDDIPCITMCSPGCQCIDGFVRDASQQCVSKDSCSLSAPLVSNNNSCPTNQTWNECPSHCVKTCDNFLQESMCIMSCAEPACVCKTGYVRDGDRCVIFKDCSNGISNSSETGGCASVSCMVGQECQYRNGVPMCIAPSMNVNNETVINNNSTVENCKCKEGFVCATGSSKCINETEALLNPCSQHPCANGMVCENQEVQCFVPPCYPIANCLIPETSSTTCPTNQTYSLCTSKCAEKVCGRENIAIMCNKMCGPPGCQCSEGFSRSGDTCVLPNDCPKDNSTVGPSLTCATVDCMAGTTCQMDMNGKPSCVTFGGVTSCPTNQTWTECASKCSEPVCGGKNNAKMCNRMCEPSTCQCSKGFSNNGTSCVLPADCPTNISTPLPQLTCATVKCMAGTICQINRDGRPECITDGRGVNSCLSNQTWTECANKCAEPVCGGENIAKMCIEMCEPPACQCSKGYSNNGTSCVLPIDCPNNISTPLPQLTCATVKCMAGTICQITREGRPECITDGRGNGTTEENPCNTVDCRSGQRCMVTNGTAECVDIDSMDCSNIRCASESTCLMQNGRPRCIPDSNTCPTNQTWSDCTSSCSAPACGKEQSAMMCTQMCGPPGCQCSEGYLRNGTACVLSSDCPKSNSSVPIVDVYPALTCASMLCKQGYNCQMQSNGQPGCIPDGAAPGNGPSSNSTEEDDHGCADTEVWNACGGCEPTCDKQDPICTLSCRPGQCVCSPGLVRKNGKCVPYNKCPKQNNNKNQTCAATEEETDCKPSCEATCRYVDDDECFNKISATVCTKGCVCRPNYKRDKNGNCVHQRFCYLNAGCQKHEKWSRCANCESQCGQDNKQDCSEKCHSGCACQDGYSRDPTTKDCVPDKQC